MQMCFDLHRMCELYRGASPCPPTLSSDPDNRCFAFFAGDEPQMNMFACFLDESYDTDDFFCFLVEVLAGE